MDIEYGFRVLTLQQYEILQKLNKFEPLEEYLKSGFIHLSPTFDIATKIAKEKNITDPYYILKIKLTEMEIDGILIKKEYPQKLKMNWMDSVQFIHVYHPFIKIEYFEIPLF